VDLVKYSRNQWDRIGAWLCIAGGIVALIVGYVGLSSTLDTGEQLPYVVSGGLVGLFLIGLGALLWLSADLRGEWRKLDAIDRHLVEGGGLPSAAKAAIGATEPASERDGLVIPREVSLR
jgi:hypothetical protein